MFNKLIQFFLGWNFVRIARLILGVFAIGAGFSENNLILGVFGGVFIYQSILNTTCCGETVCSRQNKFSAEDNNDEITFQEIKNK